MSTRLSRRVIDLELGRAGRKRERSSPNESHIRRGRTTGFAVLLAMLLVGCGQGKANGRTTQPNKNTPPSATKGSSSSPSAQSGEGLLTSETPQRLSGLQNYAFTFKMTATPSQSTKSQIAVMWTGQVHSTTNYQINMNDGIVFRFVGGQDYVQTSATITLNGQKQVESRWTTTTGQNAPYDPIAMISTELIHILQMPNNLIRETGVCTEAGQTGRAFAASVRVGSTSATASVCLDPATGALLQFSGGTVGATGMSESQTGSGTNTGPQNVNMDFTVTAIGGVASFPVPTTGTSSGGAG